MSKHVPTDRASQLRKELEALGYGVILWCPDDFPGDTPEQKQENFDEHIETVIDLSIERGSEAISSLCE
jgi:hypothetical protein